MSFVQQYLEETQKVVAGLNAATLEKCVDELARVRERGGRLFILAVGGGNLEKNVSPNLVSAIQLAKQAGASIVGIVGRDGGYTAKEATACVIVPTVNPEHVTPHSEAFQAVVWHLFVSHPKLKMNKTKWEGTK